MNLEESSRLCKRNLLGISVFISFYYYGGVSIESISFLGAKSTLTNNDALIQTAWLIWGYFFFRYIQFYIELGHSEIKKVKEEVLHNELSAMLIGSTSEKLKYLEKDHYLKRLKVEFRPFLGFGETRLHGGHRLIDYYIKKSKKYSKPNINLLNYKFERKSRKGFAGKSWNVQVIFSDISYKNLDDHSAVYRMSIQQTKSAFFKLIKVYFVHPATSEYLLPIILSLFPLLFKYHA